MKQSTSSNKSIPYNNNNPTQDTRSHKVKRKKGRSHRRALLSPPSLHLVGKYIREVVEELHVTRRELERPRFSDYADQTDSIIYPLKQSSPPASSLSAFISDWTGADELLQCADFPGSKEAYKFALKKAEIYPTQFSPNGSFLEDIGIVTMSDINKVGALSFCRPKMKRKDGWKCNRHCFCHYCNYLRFSAENDRLTECFDQHAGQELYRYTLSWNQPIPLGDDFEVALILWDLLEAAVREAQADHLFDGLFFAKEMAITGFLPARGIPHAHGFVFSPRGGEELSRALGRIITQSEAWQILLDSGLVPANFSPNFEIQATTSPEGCRNWLFYSLKVLSLAARYKEAFATTHPSLRLSFNEEVSDIVACYDLEMGRNERGGGFKPLYRAAGRVLRLGNLHWSSRQKVVTAKRNWKDDEHIELRDTIRRQAQIDATQKKQNGGNLTDDDKEL